jgi:hypothetical protein
MGQKVARAKFRHSFVVVVGAKFFARVIFLSWGMAAPTLGALLCSQNEASCQAKSELDAE